MRPEVIALFCFLAISLAGDFISGNAKSDRDIQRSFFAAHGKRDGGFAERQNFGCNAFKLMADNEGEGGREKRRSDKLGWWRCFQGRLNDSLVRARIAAPALFSKNIPTAPFPPRQVRLCEFQAAAACRSCRKDKAGPRPRRLPCEKSRRRCASCERCLILRRREEA